MSFPQHGIVSGFKRLEAELLHFQEFVPFIPEHKRVWSPALVPCIFEACTQLDSLWKARGGGIARDADIRDHFAAYGSPLADKWLITWGEEGQEIRPFEAWSKVSSFNKDDFIPLPWWQAYNKLKHDRWLNVREATFENAINAASSLFLAIVKSPECADAIGETDWCHFRNTKNWTFHVLAGRGEDPTDGAAFESQLFSYALGSSSEHFKKNMGSFYHLTPRFGRFLGTKYSLPDPTSE